MNYLEFLKEAVFIFFRQKAIWGFVLIYLIVNLLIQGSSIFQEISLGITCVVLLFTVVSFYLSLVMNSALVQISYRTLNAQDTSFEQAWMMSRSYITPIFLLSLFTLPVIIVELFVGYLSAINPTSIWLFVVSQLALYFSGSVIIFGTCKIVIDDLPPGKAAWTGFTMVLNNFGKLLIINGFFLLVTFLLLTDLVLLVQVLPNQALLLKNLSWNYQTWSAVLDVPFINILRSLLFVLLYPLQVIIHTLIYERITWAIEHPGIRRKRQAA